MFWRALGPERSPPNQFSMHIQGEDRILSVRGAGKVDAFVPYDWRRAAFSRQVESPGNIFDLPARRIVSRRNAAVARGPAPTGPIGPGDTLESSAGPSQRGED